MFKKYSMIDALSKISYILFSDYMYIIYIPKNIQIFMKSIKG